MLKRTAQPIAIGCFLFSLTLISGCTAAAFGKPSLQTQVQSAVSSGHITVVLDGTQATLRGQVENRYDRNAAGTAAKRYEGVEQVINRIRVVDR